MLTLIADGVELGKSLILNAQGTTVESKYGKLSDLLQLLLPNALVFAGIILLMLLIFGGFSIITSAGNAKNVEKGAQAITGAIIGFFVIFAAYWIIQIIQLVTGINIFGN
jgi:hypothetical protein